MAILLFLDQIIDLFYLSSDYNLMHLEIEAINESIVLDENNPNLNLIINEETLIYDCNADLYGAATCDECGVCYGGNTGLEANQGHG